MNLKDYRKSRGLTQAEAASQICNAGTESVSTGALCRYERGRFPEPEIARQIISWSGGKVTADDLLNPNNLES